MLCEGNFHCAWGVNSKWFFVVEKQASNGVIYDFNHTKITFLLSLSVCKRLMHANKIYSLLKPFLFSNCKYQFPRGKTAFQVSFANILSVRLVQTHLYGFQSFLKVMQILYFTKTFVILYCLILSNIQRCVLIFFSSGAESIFRRGRNIFSRGRIAPERHNRQEGGRISYYK